jgi:alkylation response protein AidB-like acyl-CoA dehydrogenase
MEPTTDISEHNAAKTDWVARVRPLMPLLKLTGPRGDADGELSSRVVDALHEVGLFRLLIPRDLGGEEVDLLTFSDVIEAVAEGDGSTAWCLGQNAVSNMTSAYMPHDEANSMFGNQRAVLAWGAGVSGQAAETKGGFQVTGQWGFASGSRHANWLGGQAPIVSSDGTRRLG